MVGTRRVASECDVRDLVLYERGVLGLARVSTGIPRVLST